MITDNLYRLFLSAVFSASTLLATAQTNIPIDTTDISTLSLEDLMKYKSNGIASVMDTKINTSVAVGTLQPLSPRKSPSILSVINEEEIKRSGARDLIDALNLVPGLNFNVDVEGVVGISIRGNWANEGKVLLLFDGLEMNETVYGTLQFGNRYPIDQIKRIEIIRGPGSAIYGGAAEYAVINVITKNAADISGVQANVIYARTKNALARNTYNLAFGKKIKDLNVSFSSYTGLGNKSDKTYTDIYGSTWDMKGNSTNRPLHLNLGTSYRSLSFRAMYDDYKIDARDGYDALEQGGQLESFKSLNTELKYEWKLNRKLTFIPKLTYKRNSPYEIGAGDDEEAPSTSELAYKTVAERYKCELTTIWETSKKITTTLGTQYFYDKGVKKDGNVFRNSGKSIVSYNNAAGFVQSIYKNNIANVIAGARYDYNNSFGSAFVPRLGLTKRMDRLNLKLLYSSSFKAPAIENVETSLAGSIQPEKTRIWEFEAGYQLNDDMFLTVNIFDIATTSPIIYFVDTSATNTGVPDGYINADKSGTQGLELEYKYADTWGYLNLNYSYYSAAHKPHAEVYENPFSEEQVLGIGNHKLSASSSINVTHSFYVSPSIIYSSGKTGIVSADEDENYIYKKLNATYELNLNFGFSSLPIKGLSTSFGIYNLLNENLVYVQPYASGHAPLPGSTREYLIKLNYRFQ